MAAAYEPLDFTGERMVPEKADLDVFWEHVYRYRFALAYVRGKRVLDIACGEGYGSAALKQAGAASVIGMDISEETCLHARSKYGVDARVGSAEAISLPDQSVDVVVSFETIEHLEHPETFLSECYRVLVPGGQIVISTPNKDIYRFSGEQHNPFHCFEMNADEFAAMLAKRFVKMQLFAQRLKVVSWRSPYTLAANVSVWDRSPRLQQIRTRLRHFLGAEFFTDPGEGQRLSVVARIASKDSFLSRLVNPYLVRKYRSQMIPIYIVAVAQKSST